MSEKKLLKEEELEEAKGGYSPPEYDDDYDEDYCNLQAPKDENDKGEKDDK